LIRELGRLVVGRVEEELPTKRGKPGWASASIEARWLSDTELRSWAGKLRIVSSTGEPSGVQITWAMEDLIHELSAMRLEVFPEPWYRLKLTLSPDTKPQLELNRDSDSVNDPEWYLT
jgi:hypothetical protein